MAIVVSSATDLYVFWQGKLHKSGSEWKGPCPFCSPQSQDGAVVFEGVDRFFWYPDGRGGYCRTCDANFRGSNNKGYWRIADIAKRFGVSLADNFDYSAPESEEKPLSELWTISEVEESHEKVDHKFWYMEYGWPKDLVNKFKLGMGNLYPERWRHDFHIIPMKGLIRYGEEPLDYYYMAARFRETSGKKLKERGRGSSKPYLWLVESRPESKECVLVEGDTDGITAAFLGYENFAATFGSRTWSRDKAQLLKERGYERIIVLADGDAAGQALAAQQIETCLQVGLSDIWVLQWPDGDERDISQLYKDMMDPLQARAFINSHLDAPESRIQQRLNPYSAPQGARELVDLETLRGASERSLRHQVETFIASYDFTFKRGKGKALHLQAPEGSGKTHVLIEIAERLAAVHIEAKMLERTALENAISEQNQFLIDDPLNSEIYQETIETLQRKLDTFSLTAIAWYGQYKAGWDDLIQTGANPALWYNYEARGESNCQNIKRVAELGAKNHDIGHFCQTACPFFRQCQETGYLKQEKERKEKPITFFRHHHLMANHESSYKVLTVIDEFAGTILENDPIRYEPKHIYPSYTGWEIDVDSMDMVRDIEHFAEALRATLSSNAGAPMRLAGGVENPDYIISGAKFIDKLNQHCKSIVHIDIFDLLLKIDRKVLHQVYQPNFSGGENDLVHLRCLPQTYDVLMREIIDYDTDPENRYPSCIHLVSGYLELYASHKAKNRQRTPMIIADATGMPVLYEAMFGREVQVFSPMIRNANAHIQILRGSDFTKSEMNAQMGAAIRDRKRLETKGKRGAVMTLTGDEFDPSVIPFGEDLYESQFLRESLAIAQSLAKKHKSLLVVTHKDLKELMESVVEATWEGDEERQELKNHLAFGHYGALRGTNKYKDYEAVVLIGVFRVPYNIVWRKIQMWAWLMGLKEEINPTIVRQPDQFGGSYPTFAHQFAEAFVDMVEEGEIRQSAARIRPHSSDSKKFVYVFANRPAMQFVSKVTTKTDFLRGEQGGQHQRAYTYILDTLRAKKPLSSLSIMRQEYRIGNSTIQKLIVKAKTEIGAGL